MALLDRIKERVETDLTDTELEALIDEQIAEIEKRYGTISELTMQLAGRRRTLDLVRPIDVAQEVTLVEYFTRLASSGTELTADADYRLLNGGRTVERIDRDFTELVEITYTPIDDQPQRDEVTIKLVQLAIRYSATTSESVGDTSESHVDQHAEREQLLRQLSPRTGAILK